MVENLSLLIFYLLSQSAARGSGELRDPQDRSSQLGIAICNIPRKPKTDNRTSIRSKSGCLLYDEKVVCYANTFFSISST